MYLCVASIIFFLLLMNPNAGKSNYMKDETSMAEPELFLLPLLQLKQRQSKADFRDSQHLCVQPITS